MDFDKLFPAFLTAAIVLMISGFIAKKVVHPEYLKKDAVKIEGTDVVASAGPAKPQLPAPILHLIATADIARGAKLSKACAACHSFDQGGVNKVGPNIWNVVNAPKGQVDGFAYSSALLEKGGDWGYESLNGFMWKPKKYINGTKMNYAGLKKPEDRAALIAWLRTLSSSPASLPSQAAIDAEAAAYAAAMGE